ncbi:NAD-dependent epimerase/dehydratase [Cellulomonas flavigena DSM 20109]|uniref:NAD-dependent epimerase/dehydratase n=1 Tax=Cellulomonas flavigena (strain ATCC 482 / DSM 20109 / BCRC 11376 / JCM 18109 / NBRC 3775 / NCIMB 8073 / NRS 134) TaxID=446466 RepID=D5UBV9_CELFN|nr:NAD(P)H-binding protein [Cellulomonas flavigena]ADG76118.1 NAD-dependent epimerase/dehydratase [Cellulomonas flavigena DSM 20109]
MRVVVVGGHGKVARLLAPLLVARGDEVVPLVRRPEHADELAALGAQPALLDIEASDADDFAAVLRGADAVVFAAGAGPDGRADRKRTVDLEGSLKSQEGARLAGVRRFVQVSAIGVDEPITDDMPAVWAAYVVAKRDADSALRDTDLEWTILRPGGLTDDEGTGRVALAEHVERGQVTRADVAAVVAAALREPATIGRQLELVAGDTPVEEAVAAA